MEEAEKFQGRKIRGPTLCTQFNDHDFTEPEFFVPSLVASPSPKKKVPDAEKKGHAAKSPQLRDLPPDPKDSLPLRVMAHCAMYSVPNIVGLDEYSYDVAARMAARAEARAVQEVLQGQETAASAPNARPIFKVPKEARQSRGTKEHLVEPGSTGSALILWNSSKVHSTDSGASQLRKRRRKLTDDLLRKMVVNHGDSLGVVSWWFRVFEFYADAPVESVLPALPESRPEDDKPRASLLRRSSSRPQSAGAVERGSENPFTGSQGVSRTRLRQHPGMPQVEKASVDDVKFQEHREELRETRKGLQASGLGYGELDLMRLLRRKKLDSATFEVWENCFEAVKAARLKHLVRQGGSGRRGAALRSDSANFSSGSPSKKGLQDRKSLFHRLNDFDSQQVQRCWDKELTTKICGKTPLLKGYQGDGHSSDDEEMQRLKETVPKRVQTEAAAGSAREIMLRTSSLALLDSSLMKKSAACGLEKRPLDAYEEVMGTRSQILRNVKPVEMTVTNLARILTCFGVERKKTAERIAGFLLVGSLPDQSITKLQQDQEQRVPFEVFYRFMKALQGGRSRQEGAAEALASDGAEPLAKAWRESELLRRLLFAVLTGQNGISRSAGAAAQRGADSILAPLSFPQLLDSLRLMLCTG
ncbi:unnamed protein product, partial [Polarella glacialis]